MILVSIAVAVIVIVAFLALRATYQSDSSMNALLFYGYSPSTETSESSVRVWGDVYNLGSDDVDALLHIIISDDDGHSSSHDARIGVVRAFGNVDVSVSFPWPYPCSSSDDLTVEYDVRTRSAGLF